MKRAKPKGKGVEASGPTLLDSFVVKAAVDEDVIMNEDGTMYAADSTSS